MREILYELVGPIDLENSEATLEVALEKKDKERAVI